MPDKNIDHCRPARASRNGWVSPRLIEAWRCGVRPAFSPHGLPIFPFIEIGVGLAGAPETVVVLVPRELALEFLLEIRGQVHGEGGFTIERNEPGMVDYLALRVKGPPVAFPVLAKQGIQFGGGDAVVGAHHLLHLLVEGLSGCIQHLRGEKHLHHAHAHHQGVHFQLQVCFPRAGGCPFHGSLLLQVGPDARAVVRELDDDMAVRLEVVAEIVLEGLAFSETADDETIGMLRCAPRT